MEIILKWRNIGRGIYEAKVGLGKVAVSKQIGPNGREWQVFGNALDPIRSPERIGYPRKTLQEGQKLAMEYAVRALAEIEARKPKSEADKLADALEQIIHMTNGNNPKDCSELLLEIHRIAYRAIYS